MQHRVLGTSDLKVSPICLGGNTFGWASDEAASFRVLDAFVEKGGNFIDTADVYSAWVKGNVGGESETILGRWMKTRKNRAGIVLATKVGNPMGPKPDYRGLSRRHIFEAVEGSLKRLQTDVIDLYQSHVDDPETPQEETLTAYQDLIRQGKVRAVGASNFNAARLAESLALAEKKGLPRYVSLQPSYNLIDRADFEKELQSLCVAENVGVISYFSLARGFLSGKYRRGEAVPAGVRAEGIKEKYLNEKGFALLDVVNAAAREVGASATQVSLAWLLTRPGVTAPIVSATTPEQVAEIVGAADVRLPASTIAALNQAGLDFAH